MIDKSKVCCFTGHRKILVDELPEIKKRLEQEVENLIEQGVICFGCGGALGFDTLAAQTIIKLRKKYSEIKLVLILPCAEQTRSWSQGDKEVYEMIRRMADKVRVLSEHYYRGCMQVRNRYMVDNSGVCICYLREKRGGTAYTVEYAKRRGVRLVEI